MNKEKTPILTTPVSFEERLAKKRHQVTNLRLFRLAFLIISLSLLALYLFTPLFEIIS
jgi:hypothetical protein